MSEMTRPPANWQPYFLPPPVPPRAAAPRRRRLPAFVGGAVIGAVIAAAVTAAFTAQPAGPDSIELAPVTVTATPPPKPPQLQLTTAEADRRTCQTYTEAGRLIRSATESLQVIPPEMTILSPEVRANNSWSEAVQRAGELYERAATTQTVAPGSTLALDQVANAFRNALQAMSTAYGSYDAAVGDIYATAQASDGAMAVLCNRLAPL